MKKTLLLTTGLALMTTSALVGADRLVIIEDFNATWCSPCQPVGRALNDLQSDYLADVFVFQVHQADAYATTWGNQRANFYGVPGYPTVWVDGVLERVGSAGQSGDYIAFSNMLSNRLAVETDVIVDILTTPLGGNQYRVDAYVGIEADGTGKTMRVEIVQVLDNTPSGDHYVNCFMRAMGYQTITLAPGEWALASHVFTLTGESVARPSDVRFAAFAQANNASAPAEIYNADRTRVQTVSLGACCLTDGCFSTSMSFCTAMGGEFSAGVECADACNEDACPGDADGDGLVAFSDLLLVLGNWGPCDACAMDFDGDNLVGFSDLLLVLGLWGECP